MEWNAQVLTAQFDQFGQIVYMCLTHAPLMYRTIPSPQKFFLYPFPVFYIHCKCYCDIFHHRLVLLVLQLCRNEIMKHILLLLVFFLFFTRHNFFCIYLGEGSANFSLKKQRVNILGLPVTRSLPICKWLCVVVLIKTFFTKRGGQSTGIICWLWSMLFYQKFCIFLHLRSILYMDILQVIYSFFCWWIPRPFPVFGYYE